MVIVIKHYQKYCDLLFPDIDAIHAKKCFVFVL